jgi:hypothetical protein
MRFGLAPAARLCSIHAREDLHPPKASGDRSNEVSYRRESETVTKEEIHELVGLYEPGKEFFNGAEPVIVLQEERPEHIRMIQLKIAGKSNQEIAAFTGYTPCHVGTVLRQPWARKRLLEEFQKDTTSFHEYMQGAALASLQVLEEIRDDQNAPASARVTSAMNLVDRFFGKPTQRVETFDGGKAPSLKDMEALDAELAKTQEELEQLEKSR